MKAKSPIKIACISDIHNPAAWVEEYLRTGYNKDKQFVYPDVDLVIFAGDFCNSVVGCKSDKTTKELTRKKVEKSLPLFKDIFPKAKIIFLPGNHDCYMDKKLNYKGDELFILGGEMGFLPDIFGLNIAWDNTTSFNVYSLQKRGENVHFANSWNSEELRLVDYQRIFEDVEPDIFISHQGPYGVLDKLHQDPEISIGSRVLGLYTETQFKNTRYFIFGHNHCSDQVKRIMNSHGVLQTFINASIHDNSDKSFPETVNWKLEPYIFDYLPPVSKKVYNTFRDVYLFWEHVKVRHSKMWPQSARECSHCGTGFVPYDLDYELKINVPCINCIDNYLANTTEYNFKEGKNVFFYEEYLKFQDLIKKGK